MSHPLYVDPTRSSSSVRVDTYDGDKKKPPELQSQSTISPSQGSLLPLQKMDGDFNSSVENELNKINSWSHDDYDSVKKFSEIFWGDIISSYEKLLPNVKTAFTSLLPIILKEKKQRLVSVEEALQYPTTYGIDKLVQTLLLYLQKKDLHLTPWRDRQVPCDSPETIKETHRSFIKSCERYFYAPSFDNCVKDAIASINSWSSQDYSAIDEFNNSARGCAEYDKLSVNVKKAVELSLPQMYRITGWDLTVQEALQYPSRPTVYSVLGQISSYLKEKGLDK